MKTRSELILSFNRDLEYEGAALPPGVKVMNPFRENPQVLPLCESFYDRFYNDQRPRRLILGINPGRLGAGATGIPFTDTKRYARVMNLSAGIGMETHEPSSVFVYEVIEAFGGADAFFGEFYINSVCPLGFTMEAEGKRPVNFNYYDNRELEEAVTPFIQWNIMQQISIAGSDEVCYCLGSGKNFDFLSRMNQKGGYFKKMIPLDHPRFVMQYKAKDKESYIQAWLDAFK